MRDWLPTFSSCETKACVATVIPPKITEWVNVRMIGKGVKPIMDEPVTVCGTFHVGDVRERGDLVGIYRLDAEKLLGPTR